MHLRLPHLLRRLGEMKRLPPPTRAEVSRGCGIDLPTITRVFATPYTKLSISDLERIVGWLFSEFRPFIAPEVSDEQLMNHLRFELVDFQHEGPTGEQEACCYTPGGRYNLKDIG